jgi:hypothetical protein
MIVNGLNILMWWVAIATPDLIRGKQSHEIALRPSTSSGRTDGLAERGEPVEPQAQGKPIMVSLSNHSLLAMTAFEPP